MDNTHIKELMSDDLLLVEKSTTITNAAKLMRDKEYGALPVIDKDKLVGIVTDRDLVMYCIAQELSPANNTVEIAMSSKLYTCNENQLIKDAADIMSEQDIRRLVIVNDNGTPVGMLSHVDIFKCAYKNEVNDDIVHRLLKYA